MISINEKDIKRFKKRHLAPGGEMEHLKLDKKLLEISSLENIDQISQMSIRVEEV